MLSWQDTRSKQKLVELKQFADEIQQLSGLPLAAHYGASKLSYLLNNHDVDNKTATKLRLSPLISYILFHLLEEQPYIVDHGNAQRTQLFSLKNLNWSTRLTELFNVPVKALPDCVPITSKSGTSHGTLTGTQIPVYTITGDQNAAIYGTGPLTSDTILVNLGSGAFILSPLKGYQSSKKQLSGIAYSDNESVQYVREATINGAGCALTWLEKKHKVDNVQERLPLWIKEIEYPPVFINTVGGLGSPWWRSDINPKFIFPAKPAEKTASKLASQAVAVIESIIFMVCINLDIIRSEQSFTQLRVSGGLSNLDGLCQRLANLSGLTVERVNMPETTARGVAWLAAGKPDVWSLCDFDRFTPEDEPELKTRYSIFSESLAKLIDKTD